MDDPLGPIAADDARHAGVGGGRALCKDAPQLVAALGLHHIVHILPGRKPGPEGNGQRSHIPGGAQIPLGQDGVHHHVGLCRRDALALGVHEDGHCPAGPNGFGLGERRNGNRPQPLHSGLALIDRFAQGDLTADGGRVLGFQHQHPQPGGPQPMDGAGGKVAAAPHNDQMVTLHRVFLHSKLAAAAPWSRRRLPAPRPRWPAGRPDRSRQAEGRLRGPPAFPRPAAGHGAP